MNVRSRVSSFHVVQWSRLRPYILRTAPVEVTACGSGPCRRGAQSHHSRGQVEMQAPESTSNNSPLFGVRASTSRTSAIQLTPSGPPPSSSAITARQSRAWCPCRPHRLQSPSKVFVFDLLLPLPLPLPGPGAGAAFGVGLAALLDEGACGQSRWRCLPPQ
eukprot:12114567-Heterocapsa_arctica.AAC.2